MAKEAPVLTINVDDSGAVARNISNDVIGVDFATPRGIQDSTGMDKTAHERLLLLADFSCTLKGIFNDAVNLSHDVFKTVPSTAITRTVSLAMSGQTLATECVLSDYALSRAQSGELTWSVPGALQDGTAPTWA